MSSTAAAGKWFIPFNCSKMTTASFEFRGAHHNNIPTRCLLNAHSVVACTGPKTLGPATAARSFRTIARQDAYTGEPSVESAMSPLLSQNNTTVGLVNFYSPTSLHVLPTCPPFLGVDTVTDPPRPLPSQPAHASSRLPFHNDFGVFLTFHRRTCSLTAFF